MSEQRIIKFRVWLERTKDWFYSDNAEYQKYDSIDTLTSFFKHMQLLENTYEKISVIMQYTGLKDKNGKEIYEGDIIRHHYAGKQLVYWFHNGWSFKDNEEDENYLPSYEDWDYVEVIGNIYENPELLKMKKNK